jgi:hypothetical protein
VRFGVSHVLDAIERRISIDPTAAGGVIDLGEVVRLVDLDGGRPAHLLRLGLVIDTLARHLSDGAVAIYAVADRSLMSDTDITANERMVIRRWSDDGKIEVVRAGGPAAALRIREVAALTGLPLLTRNPGGYPGPSYAPVPGPTGPALAAHQLGAGPAAPANVFSRNWRCPERICASFGAPGTREPDPFGPPPEEEPRQVMSQPPPQLINGVPHCPRHGAPLQDYGPRPRAVALSVRVKGVAWHRFVVTEADPVVVGRAPEEEDGVGIGLALDEQGLRWVSRSHVRFELRGHTVQAVDLSTNGTGVLRRTGPGEQPRRSPLNRGEAAQVNEWDTVELYEGVEVGRADRGAGPVAGAPTNSVMTEAPTQAMRLS